MNKSRGKKFRGKKDKRGVQKRPSKKKQKDSEPVNKKSQFNRYKNKQRVEEELAKKRKFEETFRRRQESSESEEEETSSYQQLLSTFSAVKKRKVEVVSEDESSESDRQESDDGKSQAEKNTAILDGKSECEIEEIGEGDELEEEENESAEDSEPERVNEDSTEDPFNRHLQHDLDDALLVTVSAAPPTVRTESKQWPQLGSLIITIPEPVSYKSLEERRKVCLLEEKTFTKPGTVPRRITRVNYEELFIKSQIHSHIVAANQTNLIKNDVEITEIFTPLQRELFSIINNYQDLYYPQRTFSNGEEIRFVYCLHAINHMLKTRTKILHHNAKLSSKDDVPDDFRDQGLVRPKVLILVPFKDAAYRIVKTLIDILVPKEAGQVVNKNRFDEDFTGGELAMPRKNPKPEDYELLFSGNSDDTFRLGMTVTKKTLKLYTDFYSSDILVASPLGLRTIIGAEGDAERDYDFLASLELLILDQADVFLMQNWDHLLHVMDHIHLQPKQTRGTDFSRVRSWAVNGWTKYYRQTVVLSSVALPELSALLSKRCHNYAGKVRVVNPPQLGSIGYVALQLPQLFQRFIATNPLSSVDERFDFFTKEILPRQKDTLMAHTLVYVPSYFDYVRIRNYFKKEDIAFVQICEYSKDAKIARARDMFFHTEAHFLLYSERAHFFRRFRMKGIRHLVFYQPPTYPHFYSELCNLMQEANQNKYGGSECNMSVTVLYCKYDLPLVAPILGATRTATLASADKSVHMFMTGDRGQ